MASNLREGRACPRLSPSVVDLSFGQVSHGTKNILQELSRKAYNQDELASSIFLFLYKLLHYGFFGGFESIKFCRVSLCSDLDPINHLSGLIICTLDLYTWLPRFIITSKHSPSVAHSLMLIFCILISDSSTLVVGYLLRQSLYFVWSFFLEKIF